MTDNNSVQPPIKSIQPIQFIVPWDAEYLLKNAPKHIYNREIPMERLVRAVLRKHDPAVMMLADSGCGKTALLQGLALRVFEGKIPALEGYTFLQLDIPAVITAVTTGKIGTTAFADSITTAARVPRSILLIDDFHMLWAMPGFSVSYLVNDMPACFKPLLYHSQLRAIFTSIPKEFETKFAPDAIYSKRLSLLYLDELSGESLRRATRDAAISLEEYHGVSISEQAIEQAVQVATDRALTYRPPASCVRLLDDACAHAVSHDEHQVNPAQVKEAAKTHMELFATFEKAQLRSLESELSRRVLVQTDAVSAVARRVRLTKLGLDSRPQRPDGVFLFMGPSGVGKTEMAKAIAQCLYGDLSRLVRLDMSEYMGQHEYSKLIGAPPGYLGYGEEGHLTGPISKLGHAVVLLDEIEKAHPNCLRLFLQVFDEGILTDGKGRHVSFANCVLIMTSNMGKELWAEGKKESGFLQAVEPSSPNAKRVLDYLLKELPSEFVNRIDDLVPFRAFTRDDLVPIAKKMMTEETAAWEKRGRKLLYDDSLVGLVVDTGYNVQLGARHLARNLERLVTQPISEAACQDDWRLVHTVRLVVEDKLVRLELSPRIEPKNQQPALDSQEKAKESSLG
jgi:ATP-dependent Clp protease ATP-binding subunit ClpA